MKIDARTVEILKNFNSINPSIVIEEGNLVRTMAPSSTIFAQAKVPYEFPTKSAIYDLKTFLGLLSLNDEPEVDFSDEKYITISGKGNEVRFGKAEPRLISSAIVAPPEGKTIKLKSKDVQFDLPHSIVEAVMKALAILQYEEIVFSGSDGKLKMSATIAERSTDANYYSAELGETDANFLVVVDAKKFRLLPRDYKVTISKSGFVHLISDDEIEYWLAISKKSKFD